MKTRRHPQKGTSFVLMLLALVFALAGFSRLGIGVAEVIAAESSVPIPEEPDEAAAPDPGDLLMTLRLREERLVEAERKLSERQAQLKEFEREIASQMTALQQAEDKLAQTLQRTATASEDDINRLTAVYEHMRPQQAAELFAQMDTAFAAGFVARLRPDFAGEVMANIDPIKAYAISAVLAGRHARTPQD